MDEFFEHVERQRDEARARLAEGFHYVAAASYRADIEEYHRQRRRQFNGTSDSLGRTLDGALVAGWKARGGSG
jgi:hypothetical protein